MKINFLVIFILTSLALPLSAKDVYDIPEVKPILNPLYPASHEFSVTGAYFPVGAFNKHLGLGGTYLYYFTPNHTWEVTGYGFTELPSSLKKVLIESYGASENDFAVLQGLVKTGYQWVPFYTKSILFNSTLIHSRTFFGFSAGAASFKIESPPMVSVGFAQDYYFAKHTGLKFAVDFLHFFSKNKYIQDQLTISFGFTFIWGSGE
ncbi:MAG: hypothetical protein K0R29_857 [Pseudobdellovibrio sp.]|jgi:outer membrane beta-barrel protein|nr:hypothetical protein [Pseudobdellovibrio sp.]